MKNKKFIYLISILMLIIIISICVNVQQTLSVEEQSTLKTESINLHDIQTEKLSFIKHYSLTPLDITLQTSQYDLPLQTQEIYNFNDFSEKIHLNNNALNLLQKNGFVVINNPFYQDEEYITQPYEILKYREIPIFITSDSLLHLYHIQFDETLSQIEEKEFYDDIWNISKELFDDSIEKYNNATGDLKKASKRNVAYFAVGLSLLQPKDDQIFRNTDFENTFFKEEDLEKYVFTVPDFVKEEVEKELELIEKHEGFSDSPIFIYREDYSQYIPRGHYTKSEKLKNYFKAFMWYGRMPMLLKGTEQVDIGESCNDFPPCKALISLHDAKIQTIQASLITSKFAESQKLKEKWNRIYSVTSFYVGLSDDLGPYEYIDALNFVFDGKFNPNDLTEENIEKLKSKLAEYMTPEIYGGTGEIGIWPPFTTEQADEILDVTKGFRLIGQRFIPDSYMFSNLVSSSVGMYTGENCEQTFTCEMTIAGPARCFPKGLDIMSLLGSERAKEILTELGDTEYEGIDKNGNKITYDIALNELEKEFNSFNDSEWNKNLYWSWLYSLKPLLKEFENGYPTFMQTKEWQNKELITALASWTELRHDTILYAKQSYTPSLKSSIRQDNHVVGYIEPVPEFYNRLLALTRMTNNGLDEMNILDSSAKHRLESLEIVLEKLIELSLKELKNEKLTEEDYDFIKNFGDKLNNVIADVNEKAKKTTIIADVHTDQNTNSVLEEGVGYVDIIVVAYKVPDGRILIGAGPVMSYYEFKHPMKDRLTDEKWREMLNSDLPKKPEWISNFAE